MAEQIRHWMDEPDIGSGEKNPEKHGNEEQLDQRNQPSRDAEQARDVKRRHPQTRTPHQVGDHSH